MSEEKENGMTAKKRLSPDEKISKLADKIEQLKKQKQAIENREKEIQRKQRTRRLIQNGALAEQYLNCEGIEPAEFEALLNKIVKVNGISEILSSVKRSDKI